MSKAKKLIKKNKSEKRFKFSGNLSDGSTFEAGEKVPNDIKPKDLDALKKMDAIVEK